MLLKHLRANRQIHLSPSVMGRIYLTVPTHHHALPLPNILEVTDSWVVGTDLGMKGRHLAGESSWKMEQTTMGEAVDSELGDNGCWLPKKSQEQAPGDMRSLPDVHNCCRHWSQVSRRAPPVLWNSTVLISCVPPKWRNTENQELKPGYFSYCSLWLSE